MTDLRVRPSAPDAGGRVIDITPTSAGWRYVGFEVRRLAEGQSVRVSFPGREACVLVLAGAADIEAGDMRFGGVGGRASVFEASAPGAVYVPAGLPIAIAATTGAEVALCTAPGSGAGTPRLITADRMARETRG